MWTNAKKIWGKKKYDCNKVNKELKPRTLIFLANVFFLSCDGFIWWCYVYARAFRFDFFVRWKNSFFTLWFSSLISFLVLFVAITFLTTEFIFHGSTHFSCEFFFSLFFRSHHFFLSCFFIKTFHYISTLLFILLSLSHLIEI